MIKTFYKWHSVLVTERAQMQMLDLHKNKTEIRFVAPRKQEIRSSHCKMNMNSQIWVMLKAKIHPGREFPMILDSWIRHTDRNKLLQKLQKEPGPVCDVIK